ncbi:MAG: SDR family oxidoreductase [Rubellimicrobium sp.]|nr:SDR family oxidoreductase [Rubellimicrobium sp.]
MPDPADRAPRGVILVTGAASGIGRAAVRALRHEGWPVLAIDRDRAGLERLSTEDRAGGLSVASIDLTVGAEVEALLDSLGPDRRLAGLVSSAARGENLGFLDLSVQRMREIYELNLFALARLAQGVALRMKGTGGGSIVNITTVSGLRANAGRAAYGSSKAAVEMLSKVMAIELAPFGIRVNTIAPGPVLTAMAAQLHVGPERARLLSRVPQGRYATPEEIAQGVLFLMDPDRSSYVTGMTLCIDGGMSAAGSFEPSAPGG